MCSSRRDLRRVTRTPTTVGLALLAGATIVLVTGCATTDAAQGDMGDEEVFDEWDADDDGYLDEDEFTANVAWFSTYDEDGDGYLNPEEFSAVGEDFANVDDFDAYDLNGDRLVTVDEFNSKLFDDLDEDEDGLLSEDDWGM